MAEPENTPIPASTPRAATPEPLLVSSSPLSPTRLSALRPKARVLHIGDPIKYNPNTYAVFSTQFDVVRPLTEERERSVFIEALRERKWGDFDAIFRPFWGTGGEMGQWDAELIDLLPGSVKVFASAGAGFDWADTKLLGEKGIIYCNSGIAAAEAVADFAVAMIISTFRHLPWCITGATSGQTSDFQTCHEGVTPKAHNLRGQVLGLIGLGKIGQEISSRCRFGLGMAIHYFDIEPKDCSVTRHLNATSHESLDSLLGAADCVVLCTPGGSGSEEKLVNGAGLEQMREGARFVNVARGSLVDEDALVSALDQGRISSAALDVHAAEPSVHEGLLRLAREGKVLLTCHNAGGTVETHKGFEEVSMRNIMAVLHGREALTPVNLQYLKKD